MDSDVVFENRSELRRTRFEVAAIELEVEIQLEELEELVEGFVNGRLYAVGAELEFDP